MKELEEEILPLFNAIEFLLLILSSPLICSVNEWNGFYAIGTVMKELKAHFYKLWK